MSQNTEQKILSESEGFIWTCICFFFINDNFSTKSCWTSRIRTTCSRLVSNRSVSVRQDIELECESERDVLERVKSHPFLLWPGQMYNIVIVTWQYEILDVILCFECFPECFNSEMLYFSQLINSFLPVCLHSLQSLNPHYCWWFIKKLYCENILSNHQ